MCEYCHTKLVMSGIGVADGMLYISEFCPKCMSLYISYYHPRNGNIPVKEVFNGSQH